MIAGDDAAGVFASRFRARSVGRARGRLDHELIGGEDEFGGQAPGVWIAGSDQQSRTAIELGAPGLIG